MTQQNHDEASDGYLVYMQQEVRAWSNAMFGEDAPAYQRILGMQEELGELCHAFLKAEQGIRGNPEQLALDEMDSCGDILIYMLDFASRRGFILGAVLESTWEKVSQRDWKNDPQNAGGHA